MDSVQATIINRDTKEMLQISVLISLLTIPVGLLALSIAVLVDAWI